MQKPLSRAVLYLGSLLGRKEKASCDQEQWRAGNVEWQIQMCSVRQQAAVQETKSSLVLRAGRVGWGLGKVSPKSLAEAPGPAECFQNYWLEAAFQESASLAQGTQAAVGRTGLQPSFRTSPGTASLASVPGGGKSSVSRPSVVIRF